MNETLTATEVILKTDQAYALVVKAKEMKVVADAYHTVLTELKKNVESAYKHGLKPQNDVLKVQVRLNESELAVRKAENAVSAGYHEFVSSHWKAIDCRHPCFR